MIIDATFWVAISFIIFLGVLIYFKIPQKVIIALNESINSIKHEIGNAEALKEESKNILSEYEKKIGNAKNEIKQMIDAATEDADRNVLKTNEDFHVQMENRKKNTEDRIKQMKNQALKDIKNASVKISIQAVEDLLKKSLDKNKLNKIFTSSVEETKLALKRKST
ncbi:ATPase [Pelagibacteraceae bacterium]|jgi:F-type H+-transporting ATPase subunit b|nr:ATPase [Pelagibacteraceae bacterium]|tara:strand:+ start:135 stop:632 length:498 start_codon:yes stop_codon:yes gene_type:complete